MERLTDLVKVEAAVHPQLVTVETPVVGEVVAVDSDKMLLIVHIGALEAEATTDVEILIEHAAVAAMTNAVTLYELASVIDTGEEEVYLIDVDAFLAAAAPGFVRVTVTGVDGDANASAVWVKSSFNGVLPRTQQNDVVVVDASNAFPE